MTVLNFKAGPTSKNNTIDHMYQSSNDLNRVITNYIIAYECSPEEAGIANKYLKEALSKITEIELLINLLLKNKT
jgi:hypothetical protein